MSVTVNPGPGSLQVSWSLPTGTSIGRMPMLRPPPSGAPSTTIEWPLPLSATKLIPSTHLMRAFIQIP